jgi:tetraacyldisaccharide 4'-kinase
VICCGNVTAGGAGKTTVAIDLGERLRNKGHNIHFLSRGYGGRTRAVTRVGDNMTAAEVGDEPLLLASVAPTWVGADREAAAQAAIAAGADILVMDDGLQNPTLCKTLSLLIIDGRTGFGNLHLLPAGPLREPVAVAASRCGAAILIGEDHHRVLASLPAMLPVLHARLVPGPATVALKGQRVLAFAGIASPEKFFATLEEAGAEIGCKLGFADHQPYKIHVIERLLHRAAQDGLRPVTTAKDAVRLPLAFRGRVDIADVSIAWSSVALLEGLLETVFHLPKQIS